jgi:hypothetical protein
MTTLQHINRSMLAMAVLAISGSAVASAQYKFTKIDIPKSIGTSALGISNKNEVVGQYVPFQSNQNLGFWRTNDVPAIWHYPLSDPKGDGYYTGANSIDSGRIVVGAYETASSVNGISDVGMFLNGGTYFDFTVNGCRSTVVNGINDRGETAGSCFLPTSDDVIGWFSTRLTGVVTFRCPGSSETYAYAINNARSIVGLCVTSSGEHGYLRDAQGNFVAIDFPNAYATFANGISDTGVISGTFQDSSMTHHGFIFSSGIFVQVDVPGASSTYVNQINKHGHFVGSYDDPKTGHGYGFLAKPIPGASILVESEDSLN